MISLFMAILSPLDINIKPRLKAWERKKQIIQTHTLKT